MTASTTSAALTVNERDFDEFAATSELPVLLDFWAPWCGPCRMFGPIVEELAEEWKDRVTLVSIDIDAQPALAMRFGVQSIPSLVLLRESVEVDRLIGASSASALRSHLDPLL